MIKIVPLLLIGLLSACFPAHAPALIEPWTYSDLRAVDAVEAPHPAHDLIALYLRRLPSEVQLRLDWLDLPLQPASDIYLALDLAPGGTHALPLSNPAELAWDILVQIPANGPILALTADQQPLRDLAVQVWRDTRAETVTVRLDRAVLPAEGVELQVEVFVSPAGESSVANRIGPVSSAGMPPPRAPVLLAFWNAFPAYTPAQALRRWDGAHTGPIGGRHGLYNLLRAARNREIPLVLLDLKTPAALSALDYLGSLNMVREMAARELLVLPDPAPVFPAGSPLALPAWVLNQTAAETRQVSQQFGLPNSPFLYAPIYADILPGQIPSTYPLIFTPSQPGASPGSGAAGIFRWGDKTVVSIPVSALDGGPVTRDDLDLAPNELVVSLVDAARLAQSVPPEEGLPLLILGGSLPDSPWGNPEFARNALDYLQAHPWVQVLSAWDLLAAGPAQAFISPAENREALELQAALEAWAVELRNIPPGPLAGAAWQAYLSLAAPVSPSPPELPGLRAGYAGQLGALLAAARWAAEPAPISTCASDPDRDGQVECVLASENFFAVFEPGNGSLAYLFALHGGFAHQLVGPSSQVIAGQSEPSGWDLSKGLSADPGVYPGAFYDDSGPYLFSHTDRQVIFTSTDTGVQKTYTLLPSGIRLDHNSSGPADLLLPLLLDPWSRFHPGWSERYVGAQTQEGYSWALDTGIEIHVTTSGVLSTRDFTVTRRLGRTIEDPNVDYPPGHFVPFPIVLVQIQAGGGFFVEISIR